MEHLLKVKSKIHNQMVAYETRMPTSHKIQETTIFLDKKQGYKEDHQSWQAPKKKDKSRGEHIMCLVSRQVRCSQVSPIGMCVYEPPCLA